MHLGGQRAGQAELISVGGIDEQAREAARRAGRATATPAMAWEAGWPARSAVAWQAGQSARAQAEHLADAARTEPLRLNLNKSALRASGRRLSLPTRGA